MNKEEINSMIDQKIQAHEIKVGFVSGIIGLVFFATVFASLVFIYFLAAS